MTLPKKNRRAIVVDSVQYHWTIGTRDDHRRGTATVQSSSGQGAKLIIDPVGLLTPRSIAEAIRFAISNGWNPLDAGPSHWLGFCEARDGSTHFVVRRADDPPYYQDLIQARRAEL